MLSQIFKQQSKLFRNNCLSRDNETNKKRVYKLNYLKKKNKIVFS